MSIKEISRKYKTSDSQEFEDKAEAERHQELIDAEQKFKDARKRFNRASLQCRRTADGKLIDMSVCATYYYAPYYGNGCVEELPYAGYDFYLDDEERLYLNIKKNDKTWQSYRLDCVYKSRAEAMKAAIARIQEYIKELQHRVAEMTRKAGE